MSNPDAHPLILQAQVPDAHHNIRLDSAMAILFPSYSRSLHKSWILDGQVKVDGTVVLKPKYKVKAQEVLEVAVSCNIETKWVAEPMALDIVFEDDDILVINKPAGLVTHPGAGNPSKTLVNAILHHYQEANTLPRAGIVHRLDKDTSGLLIVAKTRESLFALTEAMQQREIKREYEAIVEGQLIAGDTIETDIGRHPKWRTKMAVVRSGKHAVTHYRIINRYISHSHVLAQLETGRTHQIRVHFNHIKHPLVGDKVYNPRQRIPKQSSDDLKQCIRQFKRQALHARRLSLHHPITGDLLEFEADLPQDMVLLLQALHSNEDKLSD